MISPEEIVFIFPLCLYINLRFLLTSSLARITTTLPPGTVAQRQIRQLRLQTPQLQPGLRLQHRLRPNSKFRPGKPRRPLLQT